MTAYVECEECGGSVPWYYAWVWHPAIAMHPGCALDRWDEEGAGALGPVLREAYEKVTKEEVLKSKLIRIAVAAYNNQCEFPGLTDDERRGGRSAIRDMMVRLNLYDSFASEVGD